MFRLFANAAALICCVSLPAAAQSPEELLARHGLREEEESGRWVIAEQRRVARLLARFDEQLREYYRTAKAWRQQIQRVDALEKDIRTYEEKYAEVDRQRQRAGNLLAQQQLAQQQGLLSQRLGDLRLALRRLQNDGDSPLYDAAREHANVRFELTATEAALLDAQRHLEERYEALSANAEIAQSLADLQAETGRAAQLGRADQVRARVEAAESRAAKALAGLEFPLVSGGGHARLGMVVNGRTATFLIDDANPQTLLPLAQAERLGLLAGSARTGENPAWQSLQYGDEELRGMPLEVKAVQVGDVALHDVTVFVTDRKHAGLGPRIGHDLVDRLDLKIDRGRARITIGEPSSADRNAVE